MRAASSEVVRDINRRIVLNLIRTRQPISRADLARISGLQRSTISLIVEQLMGENWVLEGPTGRLPRGRRPTYLRLNDERVIIGVDIRPTQISVALADAHGRFSSQEVMDTPAESKTAIERVNASIRRIMASCGSKKIEGVGVSVPGRFDPETNRLVFAPNLEWRDVDISGPIARATNLDVALENAANACVLAAMWFDRPQGVHDMVVVTVSEGIGAGILANGHLVRGLSGMAGEFGHVAVDPSGPKCGCGSRGCWEVFASNRAAIRYYQDAGGPDTTFPALLALAETGDARAAGALETMAHHLGRGMRLIVAGVAPQRIVVIGDLTRSWQRFGPVIEAEVREQVLPGGSAPEIVPTHEDGMARLRGTVALVLQKHFSIS
jgi:predicted NBD/HSP70 family sugar kinase